MKYIMKERLAYINGVALNNKMLKAEERGEIYKEEAFRRLMTEDYNQFKEAFPPEDGEYADIINKYRQEQLTIKRYYINNGYDGDILYY